MFKLQILDYRSRLSKRIKAYGRKKSRVKILKFNDVPEDVLQKSLSVKLVDAVLLKQALKGAFEEVIDAAKRLESVVMRAKLNF